MTNNFENQYGIIYKVTNLVNQKVYIGLTTREFKIRKAEHFSDAKSNSNTVFHKALRKYGENNFTWQIIDRASTQDELNSKEVYWISFFNSFVGHKGYNMSLGGEGTKGFTPTEESNNKRSESQKGRTFTDEHKQNLKIAQPKGSKNHNSKLKEDNVLEIKELIKMGFPLVKIARKLNVSIETINSIKSGRTWSHLGDDVSNIKYFKVTEDDVREIKTLLAVGELTQKEIGKMFNINPALISEIKRGKSWKHIV